MKTKSYIHLPTYEGDALNGQPWNIYPRPQLQRDSFFCLNGEWDFTTDTSPAAPATFAKTIRVPFPPQSLLSGVCKNIPLDHYLYYRTTFSLPAGFVKDRVLLHFGAVEQYADVFINDVLAGSHVGGFLPFSIDITAHLQAENTLLVRVKNPLKPTLPYGKNRKKRGGMWYTPVSGIWQTVWLESVAKQYIENITVTTADNTATIRVAGVNEGTVTVTTPDGAVEVPLQNSVAVVTLDTPRMWSPDDPYLYNFTVSTAEDCVRSYFALRTVSIQTVGGLPRICLNGKPVFFHALLDQGYVSDGIYTPADPHCYELEIQKLKSLGFNTLRKHIKIEPALFYYACDRLGMLVWQDMVNNGKYSFLRDTALPTIGLKKLCDKWLHPHKQTRATFLFYMQQTVELLRCHPSIVYWTIFNEGWGQFDSAAVYAKLKLLDDTRIIDTASGWFKGAPSDVESEHVYFKKYVHRPADRPVILSEFGGYSYNPAGHVFNPNNTYGYRFFKTREEFENALTALYEQEIIPAVKQGLCGAVLTQVSDVEDETNGLFSYDRKITKVTTENMQRIATQLYAALEETI